MRREQEQIEDVVTTELLWVKKEIHDAESYLNQKLAAAQDTSLLDSPCKYCSDWNNISVIEKEEELLKKELELAQKEKMLIRRANFLQAPKDDRNQKEEIEQKVCTGHQNVRHE